MARERDQGGRGDDGVAAARVRRQRRSDDAVVRDLVSTAFDDPAVGDLAVALAARPGSTGFLATTRGESLTATSRPGTGHRPPVCVGHVGLSRGWVDALPRTVEVLVLSPLSVLPQWQRRGVGRALVAAAVAEARRQGAPLVFLEGDPAYYSRVGFSPAAPLGFTPPSVRIPGPAFQVVVLPAYEPWMTGALVYSDVFWSFDAVGLREGDPRWSASD